MEKKLFLSFLAVFSTLILRLGLADTVSKDAKSCSNCKYTIEDIVRVDQISKSLCLEKERYLTGYTQALLDMHYVDLSIKVVVEDRIAYLFSLPADTTFVNDIVCFVRDLPFVDKVEVYKGSFEDFSRKFLSSKYSKQLENDFSRTFPKSPKKGKFFFGKDCLFLPQNTLLFAPLVADPRQVTNSAGLRFNDKVIGNRVGEAVFGGDFTLLRIFDVTSLHGDLDFGIQAGVFSVFDLDHPEGCLVNSDFFVSVLCGFAIDKWSCRLRLWHLSSHLGDEFILTHPTFPRFNLSDEGMDFFVSYRHNYVLRCYGGLGYIVNRDLSFPERPFYCEAGLEVRPFGHRNRLLNVYSQPLMAMHFRMWEEQDFDVDQTYILGMEWSRFQDIGRKFRAFVEYHQGFSREGQFVRERGRYYGVRVAYGY